MIKRPRGTRDFFKNDLIHYQFLETTLKNILTDFNFQEIRTPLLETEELFCRSVGEETDVVSKEMYQFIDKKGRKLVLRPEGTAPIVRALIENKWYLPEYLPLKLYYLGPMFRYERPQIGRYRQFDQLGVEIYGEANLYQDLELISLIKGITDTFGLTQEVELEVNYLVSGANRQDYLTLLKKCLHHENQSRPLCDDCRRRLETNPLRTLDCKIDNIQAIENLPLMKDFLTTTESNDWEDFLMGLNELEIPWKWNPLLVRGLDYYTGLVFELKIKKPILGSQTTLLAGGRYNELVQSLDGPHLPAIGFGLGIDRFLLTLEALNYPFPKTDSPVIITVPLTKEAVLWNLTFLHKLRQNHLKVETDLTLKGLKHGFKQAQKTKARFLLVIGDKEMKNHQGQLKDQITGQSIILPLAEIPNYLLNHRQ
ncbi:histidyl-tRNA synthetase [Entomoplasma freundtii]|uniref:Histidine--tRNA ligase n=2 Tax=Entomoplasma freundtii TaxID=74700 RepID=A0A2K8NRG7_9MOLU|nr:histidyl-tRNA synthetase [Entomoplasma freundtii]TDY56587.1 histidyl-tRNA synthetase [Entomoplasma freundtii]